MNKRIQISALVALATFALAPITSGCQHGGHDSKKPNQPAATSANATGTKTASTATDADATAATTLVILFPGTCRFITGCGVARDELPTLAALKTLFAGIAASTNAFNVGVIDYGNNARLIAPLAPNSVLSPVFDEPASYDNRVVAGLSQGLYLAYRHLRKQDGRKIIVFITDGSLVDPSNFDNLIQAVAPFHAANIELHGVGVQPPPKLRDSGDHFTLLKGFADLGRYREFETLKDASALLHHILQIARTDTGPK